MLDGADPQLMKQASELMQASRYAEAAPVFFELSKMTYMHGDILGTKMMATSSAKAYVLANQPDNAASVAKMLIDRLAADGKGNEVVGIAKNIVETLRNHNFGAQADDVSTECSRVLGNAWHDPDAVKLPKFCANCGAAVKPAEILHPTPTTVACNFCSASLG